MSTHSSGRQIRYKSLTFLGYPKYWIGDDGSVWSYAWKRWHRLKAARTGRPRNWYYSVVLCSEGKPKMFKVHTLVLLAFVGPCPEGMEACHNDGKWQNNRLANLRWDTTRNNQHDRLKHNTHSRGERNYSAKWSEQDVREMRRLFDSGKHTSAELGRLFGMSKAQANKIVNRKVWRHI